VGKWPGASAELLAVIASLAKRADNEDMNIPARVENGAIVLEDGAALPEGAKVVVVYPVPPKLRVSAAQRPVQLPIFAYDGTPDIALSNDRIAEILAAEDAPG
jgi:hypothetical protein